MKLLIIKLTGWSWSHRGTVSSRYKVHWVVKRVVRLVFLIFI